MTPVYSNEQLEDAMAKKKERHKLENKAYKNMTKYSPFYLEHHPEARQEGDIKDIKDLSNKKSSTGDMLEGVESVFEKHIGSFNKLMSNSDASN